MTQRQIIHSVDTETFDWLKGLADADNCGVGEIVRRCIRFARDSQGEPAYEEASREELEAEWARAEALKRESARRALIAAKQAELDALMNGVEFEPLPPRETSVLDEDYSNEPRAEEVEVPPDPDDTPRALVARPASRIPKPPVSRAETAAAPSFAHHAMPSLLDTTAMTPPSGARPGTNTRPAPPRSDSAFGLKMGDAVGNVVRANYGHLGFSRGGM